MGTQMVFFKAIRSIAVIATICFICIPAGAYDAVEDKPDPWPHKGRVFPLQTEADGETVWHVDVDSGCSYSDHTINLTIDADPEDIKDPKIKLTNFDVDYNDSQDCAGGPEVDSLYVNGNYIGQLKGANDSWSINTFDLLPSYLDNGTNEIFIDTDATGTGCWCLGVGYVEISSKVGFTVTAFTPSDGRKNVHYDLPNITVTFSDDIDTLTLDDNILVEYRDKNGNWVEHDTGPLSLSSKRVKIVPMSDLKDGVRYRVTVKTGVLNKDGKELDKEYTWYFWTMVNLSGQTQTLYKPNTTKDKLQITWFNTVRNEKLVPRKRVVNRIYVLWDPKEDVFDADEVTEFDAKVTLKVISSGTTQTKNVTIKRPDTYSDNEKRNADNTINFKRRGSRRNEQYTLEVEPSQQYPLPALNFTKSATAEVNATHSNLIFNAYGCEMAGWYNGVPAAELRAAKNELIRGCQYTRKVFPVLGCIFNDRGTILKGSTGFNMEYTETKADSYGDIVRWIRSPPRAGGTERPEWEHVMLHLASLIPDGHRFVAGLTPGDVIPNTNGVRWIHVILLMNGNFNASTVAHEIGHEFGLATTTGAGCTASHVNDPDAIEGFSVYDNHNKSYVEGNTARAKVTHEKCNDAAYADKTPVIPLMNKWGVDTNLRWIRPENYKHLLTALPAAASMQAVASENAYMMVLGSTDTSGNVASVLPIYAVTRERFGAPSGSGYTLTVYDDNYGNGDVLATYEFGLEEIERQPTFGPDVTGTSNLFALSIPYDDDARSIEITGNNTLTISSIDFGPEAPEVEIDSPSDGDVLSGTVTVSWTGSDDNGTTYYRLEHSVDGTSWTPLTGEMIDAASVTLDTTLLPSGTDQRLGLIAYDGFHTTRAEVSVDISNVATVKATVPYDGEADVSEGQIITVYFMSEMDNNSINAETFTLQGSSGYSSSLIAGEVYYDNASRSATFSPSGSLSSNSTYYARLDGVRDIDNNTLSFAYNWSFTTGAAERNPQIVDLFPEEGTTDAPLNPVAGAVFSRPLDPATVDNSTIRLKDSDNNTVNGSASYNQNTQSVTFSPASPLEPGSTYTAHISTGITGADGLPLENAVSWSFTTGSGTITGVRITGVSYDQAEDTDSDGLYDVLHVQVRVEVVTPGSYNLNGQLRDSGEEDIAWTSATGSFSEPGGYTLELDFKGSDIGSHGIDGPYQVANLYIYNQSDLTVFHAYQNYETQEYDADDFYTVIRLVSVPDIAVAAESSNDDLISLYDYITHISYDVSDLTYRILIDSNPDAGVTLDENNALDVNPVEGFSGFSDITIEAKDSDGFRALDTIRISVLESYRFSRMGNFLISLPIQPADTSIAKVLAPLDGFYSSVLTLEQGRFVRYTPNAPDAGTLQTMEPGKGYIIRITQPADLYVIGTPVMEDTVELVTGWNLVGLTSTNSLPVTDALESVDGAYTAVRSVSGEGWQFYNPALSFLSNLTTFVPGYGYWIRAVMDTTWTLP